MSFADVEYHWDACTRKMGQWDILVLYDGTFDGAGYGNKFHDGDVRRCTFDTNIYLLMQDDGREPYSEDLGCPADLALNCPPELNVVCPNDSDI